MNSDAQNHSGCDYCGLPLATSQSESDGPRYCCFGCRVASAIANESGEEGHNRWTLTRLGLAIFFTMNVMVFTLALWSWDVYESDVALSSQSASALFELFRYLSLLLSSIVVLMLGGPLLENAYENLRHRVVTTDLLIVLGVVAAMLYSLVSLFTGGAHTYFEVACMVLVGVTLGRWLEATGKLKTTNALRSLKKLLPTEARVVEPKADDNFQSLHEALVPLDSVEIDQLVRVLPGERIATDGRIRRGQAAIDEQIVTGESLPAIKEPGDEVFAGTLNLDGDLLVTVTAPAREGALLRIVDAVTKAAVAKGHLQLAADRITSWFVPAVIVLSLVAFVAHWGANDLGSGLMVALAILLIACPCALGIATPLAIWAAMGRASEVGVLFRHGDAIQQLAGAKAICFDKTGTLTTGSTIVDRFVADADTSREELLRISLALASSSTHGLSTAIRKYTFDSVDRAAISYPEHTETRPGRGIVATLDHSTGPIYLGSLALMEENGLERHGAIREAIVDICQDGKPLACIGWDGSVRGVFAFRECLRDETQAALDSLRKTGYYVAVLTGDYAARAAALEHTLGIDIETELLPEEKLAAIRQLRAKFGAVVMVGDGINDAPALAKADVGIAMGCGADVSRDAADVCLLGNNLQQVGWSIELAKRTTTTIRQNLFWAFAYNSIGIVLAGVGWLNPIWAAVAMVGSSLFVISNSLRLPGLGEFEQKESERTERNNSVTSVSSRSNVRERSSAPSTS
ncbi:MAG: cation-translocating P-type ATPase [Planctomycetes bacterium]|nr:cation-translocating P-type ATPase [Planctomycetota bacterium]